MKFLFRLFYGKERIARAMEMGRIIDHSTQHLGESGHNYNIYGQKIREVVKPRAIDRRHPLERRYLND